MGRLEEDEKDEEEEEEEGRKRREGGSRGEVYPPQPFVLLTWTHRES